MDRPVYVECSECGFFHVQTAADCNGADRHIPEDLDEEFGEGGWVEVPAEEAPSGAHDAPYRAQSEEPATGGLSATREPIPVARHNFDRMMAVTPETDIEGNRIAVGSRVRCHDVARYDAEHDGLIFSHHSYIEGVITQIIKYTPPNWHEGVYYVVDMQKSVSPVIERSRNDYSVQDETQTLNFRGPVHILANGNRLDNDTLSFGVVRLP